MHVDVLAAGGFEDARRAELALGVGAAHPEEHGAGGEGGGEFGAVAGRRIAVEDLLQGGAAEPGADQRRDAGGDGPARNEDDAGDGERPQIVDLLGEAFGQPGMPRAIGRDIAGGGQRIMRAQHREVVGTEAGGQQLAHRAAEARSVGEGADRFADDGKAFCCWHVELPAF